MWTQITATGVIPPVTWFLQASVEFMGKMYIFGGYSTTYLNDLYTFDLHTHELTLVHTTGDRPSPRRGCSAFLKDSAMFVSGPLFSIVIVTILLS